MRNIKHFRTVCTRNLRVLSIVLFMIIPMFMILLSAPLVHATATLWAYDSAETEDTLDLQSGGPGFVTYYPVTSPKMEGGKSMYITGGNSTTTDVVIWSSFNNSDVTGRSYGIYPIISWVWGFWVRFDTLNEYVGRNSFPFMRILDTSTNHYIMWYATKFSGTSSMTFTSDYGGSSKTLTLTLGAWYWIEFRYGTYVGPPALIDIYYNGSSLGQINSNAMTNSTCIYMAHGTGDTKYDWGEWYLDYLRYASEGEYPPTNPDYSTYTTAAPSGVGSVAFSLNGTTYTTPNNQSLAYGTYNFTATTLAQSVYDWRNWTVTTSGGSTTYTDNPLYVTISEPTNVSLNYNYTSFVVSVTSSPPPVVNFTMNGTLYQTPETFTNETYAAGEFITNGGFETGDYTGWSYSGTSISTQYHYTGSYSCNIYSGWLNQTDLSVAQSVITTFGFWAGMFAGGSSASYFRIGYTDGTYTDRTVSPSNVWTYFDMTSYVTVGKTISYLSFIGSTDNPVWVDDLSLAQTPTAENHMVMTVVSTELYYACRYIFSGWLINDTTFITDVTITVDCTYTTTLEIEYSIYDPSYFENYTTLNVDGNVSATSSYDHDYYWNPHSMNTVDGELIVADLNSWSITYGDYVSMVLDSNSTDAGHIAAGTWWYSWNASDAWGIQARQPLANRTWIVSFDINVVNVTYVDGAWLRIALAVAWCDPENTTGWEVKYVERDLWDSPAALNHSSGTAHNNGNIIYKGNDVLEYRYDDVPMNTWRHYDWNISQYIEAAWGNISADARLESIYCVIEVENQTHAEVNFNNLWLRVANSSEVSAYNAWDSRVTRAEGTNANVRWVTAYKNGTDGYGVYLDALGTVESVDPLSILDNGQASWWVSDTNGTSSLTLSNDATYKMSGTDSLKLVGYRGSTTDKCFANFTWGTPSAWDDMTDYDFVIFFMRFNESELYYHRFVMYDNESEWISWDIFDYLRNSTSSEWCMVTLPLLRPSDGDSALFNFANVTQFNLWPDKTYGNDTEAYGKYFTVWFDKLYLEKGYDAYITLNAPLNDDANITIYSKKEYTGYDGQYLAFISYDGTVNGTNFQLLRPNWIHNWATLNPYSTDGTGLTAVGYSEYTRTYSGSTASVKYGESAASVLVNGSAMGSYRKLLLRLFLPPVIDEYTINNTDGDFGQDFTFGDAGEMKIMVYYQTDMTYDYESLIIDVDADHWIFADERFYDFTLTVGTVDTSSVADINYARMAFEIPTYNGTIDAWFIYSYQNWTVAMTPEFEDKNTWPVRTKAGELVWSEDLFEMTVSWKVWVTINVRDVYEYGLNVSMLVSETETNSTDYGAVVRNATWVYSHGGFSQHFEYSGDAGKIAGGEALEMYAGNNSYIYNEMIFHNLQHIKMLPEISGKVGYQAYGIYYTFSYWLNGVGWVEGLELYIEPEVIAYKNILGGGEVWISYHTAWYTNGTLIKYDDTVYMFHHGDSANVGDFFVHQAWFDFWFSTFNASTTIGGRFNAYEYAMTNDAPWYMKWLYTEFNPKTNVTKESMCYADLRDSNGEIMSCSQIQLMKIGCRLEVVASTTDQMIVITRYQVLDETFGTTPMSGIQTPAFDPTLIPTVSGGGLLGFLGSTFATMGKWLSDNIIFGGLALWPMFVGFLDTIAGWLGFPNGFSNLLVWLGNAWGWFTNGMSWTVSMFIPVFQILGAVFSKFITLLTDAASIALQFITYTTAFFDGAYTSGINFWTDFNIPQWIILFMILYPIYLVILWDEEGLDAVMSQLTFIFGIVSMLFSFLLDVIRTIIAGVSWIIESIPVVE